MAQILPGFPDLPAHRLTVTIDGTQVVGRFTYRERTASWYVDLYSVDGTALLLGRRLSPSWGFFLRRGLGPTGFFYVEGADGYSRDALGGSLRLVYFPADELPAPDAADDGLSIVVA